MVAYLYFQFPGILSFDQSCLCKFIKAFPGVYNLIVLGLGTSLSKVQIQFDYDGLDFGGPQVFKINIKPYLPPSKFTWIIQIFAFQSRTPDF